MTELAARAWVDGVTTARLVDVPDTGHCVALEWPALAAEVRGFLTP